MVKTSEYTPSRGDIIFIDFDPVKKREIGKYRPALVLSSQAYNTQTGLLICVPISSSICGGPLEVSVNNLDKPSVAAAGIIQTLSWRERKAKFAAKADGQIVTEVLARLIPLIGAEAYILNNSE